MRCKFCAAEMIRQQPDMVIRPGMLDEYAVKWYVCPTCFWAAMGDRIMGPNEREVRQRFALMHENLSDGPNLIKQLQEVCGMSGLNASLTAFLHANEIREARKQDRAVLEESRR